MQYEWYPQVSLKVIRLHHLEGYKTFVASIAHLNLLDAQLQYFVILLWLQVWPSCFAALLFHAYRQSSLIEWIGKVSYIIDHLSFLKISATFFTLTDWIKAQETQGPFLNSTCPRQALFPCKFFAILEPV